MDKDDEKFIAMVGDMGARYVSAHVETDDELMPRVGTISDMRYIPVIADPPDVKIACVRLPSASVTVDAYGLNVAVKVADLCTYSENWRMKRELLKQLHNVMFRHIARNDMLRVTALTPGTIAAHDTLNVARFGERNPVLHMGVHRAIFEDISMSIVLRERAVVTTKWHILLSIQ